MKTQLKTMREELKRLGTVDALGSPTFEDEVLREAKDGDGDGDGDGDENDDDEADEADEVMSVISAGGVAQRLGTSDEVPEALPRSSPSLGSSWDIETFANAE